jgi:arsenate reductase
MLNDDMAIAQKGVLFLCTGNSARSILSEAILRRDGAAHYKAYSAGSFPKGQVNPLALQVLARRGYPADGFRSKSWSEFSGPNAPRIDLIVTVCDEAAGEACPIWPGHPLVVHWGVADPAAVTGDHATRLAAFETTFDEMYARISAFLALTFDRESITDLAPQIRRIGYAMPGATNRTLDIESESVETGG